MTDIVERLREVISPTYADDAREAADEIERLRNEIERLLAVRVIGASGYEYVSSPEEVSAEFKRLNGEIERLRAEIKRLEGKWPTSLSGCRRR